MVMPLLYWALSLACWAYALRFGGKDSRIAFALFLGAMLGTVLSTAQGPMGTEDLPAWQQINPALFAVDFLYFIGLYALALNSRCYWPIWSAGFQLICALTHVGPLLDPYTNAKMYRGLETVWMLPMLVTMALGIAKDKRFARRGVSDSRAGNPC